MQVVNVISKMDELRNRKISRARWELDAIRYRMEKAPAPVAQPEAYQSYCLKF